MAKKGFFNSYKLSDLLKASYWDRPFRWLTFLAFSLLSLVGLYLFLHSRTGFNFQDRYGWETIQLREKRVQTLNFIFLNQSIPVESKDGLVVKPAAPSLPDSMEDAAVDKTINAQDPVRPQLALTTNFDVHQPPKKDRIDLAIEYLTNELGNGIFNLDSAVTNENSKKVYKPLGSLDEVQLKHIANILKRLPADVCVGFLQEQRFRVRSYFWLTGGPAYWEVIFWSMFGVLASLLYIVSTATREENTETGYKSSDVAYQFAKLLYAPLATLVIIFAYHVMQDDNSSMTVDIEAGKGILFFSFIAGFYSGRLMTFLDRLKDILLPFDTAKPKSDTPKNSDESPGPGEDVSLIVRVNPDAVSTETLNDIQEKFLNKTITTLSKDGLVAYKFEKTEDDQAGEFLAHQVKAGSYLLKSFLSIPVVEAAAAESQDPLVVSGNIQPTDDAELTTFSSEITVVIGSDPQSRKIEILLEPDESQG